MKKEEYARIESFMLGAMKDSAHDPWHVYRVLWLAIEIAQEEEGVDTDILIAACLLHDVGREAQLRNPELCHAAEGAGIAFDFLLKTGWEEERARSVADCVASHRYRSGNPPGSVEARILFDADKLDVTGAMGIARTLVYAGRTDVPIYSANESGILDGSEETDSFFREYNHKLRGIYDKFCTKRGGELAASRKKAAESFVGALMEEAGLAHQGRALLDGRLKSG
ncbi:MAG: HD domain-containing protein [Oscillospiraceae bacterium]|jgi:uncharacterized protein|nr:HD domain-containing protein [Oscillospiraceae bacterium]